LLLATGELTRQVMALLTQNRELGVHPFQVVHYLGRFAPGIGAQQQVVVHTEVLEHLPALGHLDNAISHPLIGADLGKILAFEGYGTPVSGLQTGNGHQQGGFAGTVGAYQ